MKYTLTINQKQALDLGITNINQAVILGLIADAHSWAEPQIIDNEVYFWTARQKISNEIPLLNLKPDSIYRHLKTLRDLGLIEYVKFGKKDCTRLTKKGKSYYVGNKSENDDNSEINPNKLGNKSENNSEINPTYKNTTSIRVTSDKNKKEKLPTRKPKDFKYPIEFENSWKILNKGDKWKAYVAFTRRLKDGYSLEDILKALKVEASKTFAQRHYTTTLNSDIDELIRQQVQEPKKDDYFDGWK